jgi:fibulin 1/2
VKLSPSISAVNIESIVTLCCNEGNDWGSQKKHCDQYKFNLDQEIVPPGLQGLCLSTVEICCAKQHRIYQCTGEP